MRRDMSTILLVKKNKLHNTLISAMRWTEWYKSYTTIALIMASSMVLASDNQIQQFQTSAQRRLAFEVIVAEDSPIYPDSKNMCHEMAANLNSLPEWPPMVCERKHNPQFIQLQPLEWRWWSAEEFSRRWPLLNSLTSSQNISPEKSKELAQRIKQEEFGVSEIVLPAPMGDQEIGSFLRQGIPRYKLSAAARRRMNNLRDKILVKNIEDYPARYSYECEAGRPSAIEKGGERPQRGAPPIGGMTQLWLYKPYAGAGYVVDQNWANITPGFSQADLVTIDETICLIRYTGSNIGLGK